MLMVHCIMHSRPTQVYAMYFRERSDESAAIQASAVTLRLFSRSVSRNVDGIPFEAPAMCHGYSLAHLNFLAISESQLWVRAGCPQA